MKVIGKGQANLYFSEATLPELQEVVDIIVSEKNYVNGERVLDFDKCTLTLEIPKEQGGIITVDFSLKFYFDNMGVEVLEMIATQELKVLALAKGEVLALKK